jgi:hypothetical protein
MDPRTADLLRQHEDRAAAQQIADLRAASFRDELRAMRRRERWFLVGLLLFCGLMAWGSL